MNYLHRNYRAPSFILLALIIATQGCSTEKHTSAISPQELTDVPISVVHEAKVTDWVEATGTVRAAQTAQLASQAMGNLVEVRVHEGDRVQKGELLAVIDDAQPKAALDQAMAAESAARKQLSAAESASALADSTLKRYQQLYDEKSVSPQEFDEVRTRQESAQAQREAAAAVLAQAAAGVAQAHKAQENTQIRAPFAGVVTEKKADAGTLAVPGMPLLTVEGAGNYHLEASVDESEIRFVRLGQNVPVTIDALTPQDLTGKVTLIVPAADPASRSFLVKVELPPLAGVRTGLFGRVRFSRGERSTILVPRTAIVDRGQLQGVYAIDANEIAGLRYVSLGAPVNAEVEVLSGLKAGEKFVTDPGGREYTGKRISGKP
jgi:RND family efflux transporter MFP subunit